MKKLSIFIILIIVIGAIFYFWNNKDKYVFDGDVEPFKVNVSFYFSEENIVSDQFESSFPINILQATEKISEKNNWSFEYKDYGEMGALINTIDEKTNGQENKYWQYFVDGEQPQISADNYWIADNQNIEWKFIESEF